MYHDIYTNMMLCKIDGNGEQREAGAGDKLACESRAQGRGGNRGKDDDNKDALPEMTENSHPIINI